MGLISQALKWQQFQGLLPPGSQLDLFRGIPPPRNNNEVESYPSQIDKLIKVIIFIVTLELKSVVWEKIISL